MLTGGPAVRTTVLQIILASQPFDDQGESITGSRVAGFSAFSSLSARPGGGNLTSYEGLPIDYSAER